MMFKAPEKRYLRHLSVRQHDQREDSEQNLRTCFNCEREAHNEVFNGLSSISIDPQMKDLLTLESQGAAAAATAAARLKMVTMTCGSMVTSIDRSSRVIFLWTTMSKVRC